MFENMFGSVLLLKVRIECIVIAIVIAITSILIVIVIDYIAKSV